MSTDLLTLKAYDYPLPKELIAQHPAVERSKSRLLHLKRNNRSITHREFGDILSLLHSGDVLIVNSSKVFPARLFGTKINGSSIEVLLLHQTAENTWKCMVSPGRRLKQPQWVIFSENLKAFVSQGDSEGLRDLHFESTVPFWEEVERIGHLPLPPYIERSDSEADRLRYQTVYAKELGSVAAPTAGLHFDAPLLKSISDKGVHIHEVILHVGIGTFRPVKTEKITDHVMHAELATIPRETAEAINKAKQENRRVICVGTTSARSVESFWEGGFLHSGSKWTDIFIYPGIDIKVMDALITNFHLPQSTLLMMISAFGGYEFITEAYKIAVSERYRFFSYGDAMFIED
ncbi:MAG: tRNA preQ1(34) S-adenosylmethionine ribosyltransferase-isomerase QueA [Candidatus Cloacimonetes bacterium]|nr:tRNA preQ1(34) S-adenosylmethionine ribosyltransferase-isomerase QueA [Candidatus Cloacimonadota bacterium]